MNYHTESPAYLSSCPGTQQDRGLPETGPDKGFRIRLHLGHPGQEDEGHLLHSEPV